MDNPLLVEFETAPFGLIEDEHFLPAIEALIGLTREQIDQITENPETPSFENTIEALERTGEQLNRVSAIFFNLNGAETNDEIQRLAQEIAPMLSAFKNDLMLNKELFERVKQVHRVKDELDLDSEQRMLLETQFRAFSRNGADLDPDKQSRLREIDSELAQLTVKFGQNVLAETNSYHLQITDPDELAGLPDGAIEAARHTAEEKELTGWVFTLDYPSYQPFMTYARSRARREELAKAYGARAFRGNEYDNRQNVRRIARLRHERARLLGFKTHADYVLQERMASTPEKVVDFLNNLLKKAKPAAIKEFSELQDYARELDGIDQLQAWDGAYYTEKLKQERFDLDDEKLKPYFPLDQVIDGVFEVANRLFDLRFVPDPQIPVYHKEVQAYRVFKGEDQEYALFYADFHPRPGKRGGAWMTSYRSQRKEGDRNIRPHVSIVCNFTKPTPTKPSLLTFREVTTLFHEFGHALHGMLADTVYSGLSGTNVYWDFVELPSQLMENWCYEKEALDLFARHYETGEALPQEYIDSIRASSTFMEGLQTLRQLSFGFLDMAWHNADPTEIEDVKAFESGAMSETRIFPEHMESCMSTSFAHIFQGGYSAGYYSYKWAEVLDADAFEGFKEKGIFNKQTADRFAETVLSKGGTEDPMELYVRFRGKEPDPDALLRRAGLLETTAS
jgi:peptidyl-dipeptidase Dcp